MGSLLSILESLPNTEEWIYSNFIMMEAFCYVGGYAKGTVELVLDPPYDFSPYCPWFWKSELSAETIHAFDSNIISFCKKCIDTNNYMLLFVDESKFSCIKKNAPLFHDIFIYGYDDDDELFFTADFTFGNGKYQYKNISFSNMQNAYLSAVQSGKNLNDEGFVVLWHLRNDAHYSFDLSHVKDTLTEYLNGYSYINRFVRMYHQAPLNQAGMDVYPFLRQYLQTHGTRKCLHNLYDHKKLMLERIVFMKRNSYLIDNVAIEEGFQQIVKMASIATNLYIKYEITKDVSILNKISSYLSDIENKERTYLSALVEAI